MIYTTVQGDTWDIIAKKVYGYERHADYLMQNNWPHIDTVIFPGNVELQIPEMTAAVSDLLPAWRVVNA